MATAVKAVAAAPLAFPPGKTIKVTVASLVVHPKAQREMTQSRFDEINHHLDLGAIGVLHVADYERNGKRAMWIIDGQTRWSALMAHGHGQMLVEVKVHTDVVNDKMAADRFLQLNNFSIVRPLYKFNNQVTAEDPDAVSVIRVVKTLGLKIGKGTMDGQLSCVASLMRVVRANGEAVLHQAISIPVAAWGNRAEALEGKIIEGLAIIVGKFGDAIDHAALISKLAKYPGGPSALIGSARGLKGIQFNSIARCVAQVIVTTYNSGRRAGKLDSI